MAFASASGHGNLPNGNFSPAIYSQKVLKFFKTASVSEEVTNTDFEGEIMAHGDTVKIIKEPEITVSPYKRGQTLTTQDINDEETTLTIDQANYYQFGMDDIEKAHEHVSFENMSVSSAGYALRDAFDQNILNAMRDGASTATALGADGSVKTIGFGASNDFTPMDVIAQGAFELDVNDVPEEGRFLVASPALYQQLAREDSKLIQVDVTSDPNSIVRNRKLGTSLSLHGFTLYKSNNTPTSVSNANAMILFGHRSATTTATSLLEGEIMRNPFTFGDLYRGLHVWGRKVLRPAALFDAFVSYGDA